MKYKIGFSGNLFQLFSISDLDGCIGSELNFVQFELKNIYLKKKSFIFLNQCYYYEKKINWNYSKFGKLWTYNLCYFDFLNQDNMTKDLGEIMIIDFINDMPNVKEGLESYPISVRCINWIKFIIKFRVNNSKIDFALKEQITLLMNHLEYHLMGNHLLENGFSLLFGSYYFRNEEIYKKATEILTSELSEQILDDGGHFELSPMYHQLMLKRLLDGLNLVSNNNFKGAEHKDLFRIKAVMMLNWLNSISFSCGKIPLFNDSAFEIAPTTNELVYYAAELGINADEIKGNDTLFESGYRKYNQSLYEIALDVGNIGPDYIPGHAHSDSLSFEMYIRNLPFIVDVGMSTYEKNNKRSIERSTVSHNTVLVDNINQSDVWGGFRVGQRAKTKIIEEKASYIKAEHDGYKKIGAVHAREFDSKPNMLIIKDFIKSKNKYKCLAFLHFAPDIELEVFDGMIKTANANIHFEGHISIKTDNYDYAPEFNKTQTATRIVVNFKDSLTTKVSILI